ncbi:hypothetical protein ABZ805_07215 [Saccharopolyspora sp. NPDC047091]|uniref:hypothetical protein n=1 Tax=Saccharopolyspora sp. NPDC047091 TaxID=3155924 RepID=UPI0033D17338
MPDLDERRSIPVAERFLDDEEPSEALSRSSGTVRSRPHRARRGFHEARSSTSD